MAHRPFPPPLAPTPQLASTLPTPPRPAALLERPASPRAIEFSSFPLLLGLHDLNEMTRREDRGAASEETLLPSLLLLLLLLLPPPLLLKKKEDVKAGKKEGSRYQRPSREEKEDGPAALVLHKEIRETVRL